MKILRLYDSDEGENATIGYCTMPQGGVETVKEALWDLDIGFEEVELKEVTTGDDILTWLGEE